MAQQFGIMDAATALASEFVVTGSWELAQRRASDRLLNQTIPSKDQARKEAADFSQIRAEAFGRWGNWELATQAATEVLTRLKQAGHYEATRD